jgi:hypothetical protein
MSAKMMKIQKVTAEMRYGTISLMTPPATEKATVASAAPFARVARGNTSVGYTFPSVSRIISDVDWEFRISIDNEIVKRLGTALKK